MPRIAQAKAVLPGSDDASAERLRRHLEHDHHRSAHELREVPLQAVDRLEHFDDGLGLLALGHTHAA
jgi:hypothetical protein